MKFFGIVLSAMLLIGGGSASAATFPTFVIDGSASSIEVDSTIDRCRGCGLTAEFSDGVDGWSWTPASANESVSIDSLIDWSFDGAIGFEFFEVAVTLAFSAPDVASSATDGIAGYFSIFGFVNGGILTWAASPAVEFAQGSILDVDLDPLHFLGFGPSSLEQTTGVTFTGAPIVALAAVPLPASLLLMLSGLGALVLVGRRRKAVPAAA